MTFSEAQWKTLRRLCDAPISGCHYGQICKAGGNGNTLKALVEKGFVRMGEIFGLKFWYITDDGIEAVKSRS